MRRIALYLQDAHSLSEGMRLAQYAEEKGFEAVWQAESRLVRDAIVPMAAFAAVTSRIKVGSGVLNNWTRNIGLLAATFLTLDDLAEGRILCGIGAWWDPLAANVGIERRKPVLAMRETVEVLRRLLRMENVTFEGEFHRVRGIELDRALHRFHRQRLLASRQLLGSGPHGECESETQGQHVRELRSLAVLDGHHEVGVDAAS